MNNHDHSYKNLFSYPRMVEDLLRGFVQEEWVQHLDFSTLERVGSSYVTEDLREREDDTIWRLRWGEEWLYIYLLLEFQSTIDRFMAVRVMVYLGLLYQDLIKTKQLTQTGRLPPVLPVVLYNGKPRWTAAEEIAELIEAVPGGLEHYLRNCVICCWMKAGIRQRSWHRCGIWWQRYFGWRITVPRRMYWLS